MPIVQYLAERGCRITGVDASTAMITMSARRLPEHHWHVADMRSVSHVRGLHQPRFARGRH
ncbi:methyltransferase domain-containing protein [Mycobacterium riyadhense]|uniref:methyltransferase domain-containing protein n=1 Tax=Mycobacterium riyadhense TaxID=486698 RepID=UPI001951DE31